MTIGRLLRASGVLILVLGSSGQAGADCPVSFRPGTAYPCGSSPFKLLVRDFNSDGKLDLAVVDNAGPDVAILLGTGDGTFGARANYPVGSSAGQITAADFNRDGIFDLAVNSVNSVSVLLGRGDGTFASYVAYPVGPAPNGITSGDFNADGVPDIAVAESQDNTVSVLLGRASGGFSPRVDYPAGASPYAVRTGDYSHDGITDLVVTNVGGNDVSILLGRGTGGRGDGTFAGPVNYPTQQYPYGVATGDFNADGITDLAVANGGTGTISILLGRGVGGAGDGTFAPAVNYPGGAQPRDIVATDLNGDGILDLAVADYGGSVRILVGGGSAGHGNGTFASPLSFPDGYNPTGIAAGDFDGDGKLDVAVTNYLGSTVTVLLRACPAPALTDVRTWLRSDLDVGGSPVTGYRVWRRIAPATAAGSDAGFTADVAAASGPRPVQAVRTIGPNGTSDVTYWEALATLPAEHLAGYGYTAPTTQDSTDRGNPYTAFFVTALTADPSLFFQSNVDSGYSVDNLAPPTPMPFVATYGATSNTLHWSKSRAPDFREFRLYRGASPAFVPGAPNLVLATSDTGYVPPATSPTSSPPWTFMATRAGTPSSRRSSRSRRSPPSSAWTRGRIACSSPGTRPAASSPRSTAAPRSRTGRPSTGSRPMEAVTCAMKIATWSRVFATAIGSVSWTRGARSLRARCGRLRRVRALLSRACIPTRR